MIDHLVYATTDLDATVAEMAERLGAEPSPGGAHIGLGTRNALVNLGDGAYLELVGPDPAQPDPDQPRPFGIDDLSRPRLVAWCARPSQPLESVAASAAWDIGPVNSMSRLRPDGVRLAWRLTFPILDRAGIGILPFFIDWLDSPHPTGGLHQPIRLVSLHIESADAERLADRLASCGEAERIELLPGDRTRLSALLDTPRGPLQLS